MPEQLVKAPARVCLFGDHQDYLGLPVIACAIDRYIQISAQPNKDNVFNIELPDLKQSRSFSINDPFKPLAARDYLGSSLCVLRRNGITIDCGFNITITGNVPINAGLSSSSALTVAWITFLVKTFGQLQDFTAADIGHFAYLAECVEHQESGGRMDQYTSAIGNSIYIDTNKDKHFRTLDLPFSELIIAESGVPKKTVEGLANLNTKAHEAIAIITAKHPDFDIAGVTNENYKVYDPYVSQALKPYYHAAFKNHCITQEALKVNSMQHLGTLMYAHHKVLDELLGITTPEIDKLIAVAIKGGAYGAKIVGSGGGGCIAVCAPKDKHENLVEKLMKAGAKDAYLVAISKGAYALNL